MIKYQLNDGCDVKFINQFSTSNVNKRACLCYLDINSGPFGFIYAFY